MRVVGNRDYQIIKRLALPKFPPEGEPAFLRRCFSYRKTVPCSVLLRRFGRYARVETCMPLRTSVLINNYNHKPFLRECVDSVLAQAPAPGEVIVYDDGSTDGSVALLRDYAARGRITLIEGAHAAAYPIGHEHQARAIAGAFLRSTGEIIFLLDGDDVFCPGKIAACLAAFKNVPRSVLVQTAVTLIDSHGARLGRRGHPLPSGADYRAATYARNDVDFYQSTSAFAFRREFFVNVLPSALNFSDGIDIAMDMRLVILAPLFGDVVALDEPLTLWRRHMRSHSVQNIPRLYHETLKRARYFNAFCRARGLPRIFPARNPRLYRQLVRRLLPEFAGNALAALRKT